MYNVVQTPPLPSYNDVVYEEQGKAFKRWVQFPQDVRTETTSMLFYIPQVSGSHSR